MIDTQSVKTTEASSPRSDSLGAPLARPGGSRQENQGPAPAKAAGSGGADGCGLELRVHPASVQVPDGRLGIEGLL
jgi:hypothetical protein